ncbi:MAG: CHAT domain-containing protein [Pyrinomonadaceae bacterium]|nr:CHAT domain-containing protein [Pyrinomonadaceae bacterium]
MPGAKVERQIAGGEVHVYSLALSAGEFVRLVVEGRGIEPVLLFQDSQGKTLVKVDSASRFSNRKCLSFVFAQAGDYQFTVRSGKNAGPGSYLLNVDEWHRAEPKDESAVAAETLMAEGRMLFWQGTAESRRQAIQKYEESLPLWRAGTDIRGEAEALSHLSEISHYLSDNRKALEYGDQALRLWRAADDRWAEAGTLNIVGFVRWSLNDYQKALEDFNRALSIRREDGYRQGEADLLHSIGVIYSALGDSQKAFDHYSQSLSLWSEIGDSEGEARTLNSIGVIYTWLGEYQKALEGFDRALKLRRAKGNRRDESYTLSNIADAYDALGDYFKALEYYEQALLLSRAIGDRLAEANALNHVGSVRSSLGDDQTALQHFLQALLLSRDLGERRIEANALGDMGSVYQKLGEYQKASDYHQQALSIRREIGNRLGEAQSLSSLGFVSSALGDSGKALEYYGQALAIRRALKTRKEEVITLFGMARVERDRGNLFGARARMEAGLEIIESLRTKVSAQDLRASFLASVRELYDFQIDLLVQLSEREPAAGHAAAALVVSERSRARSLLETLAEARADIRQGVTPELLERERSLQQQINAKAERLTRLLRGYHTAEQSSAAQKELDAFLLGYQQVQAQIRTASPRYAALTQPQPLTVKEIQQQVLDPDSLLLEYSLGEERSFLWAVSPTSITSFVLPKRAIVEAAARRVYGLLTARNEQAQEETPAQYRARLAKADAQYAQAATDLSRMLLAPVASQLGTKRLLIVSEGALQYVPFAALPPPAQSRIAEFGLRSKKRPALQSAIRNPQSTIPLIQDHEIINLPSASVLAVLRREMAGRQSAPKSVAVLADPVFQNDDPRINPGQIRIETTRAKQSHAPTGELAARSDIERSAKGVGLNSFVRLRFSRQEAEAIAAFAPQQKRLTALDFVASNATAQSAELSQYRIVHFATHGLLNSQQPELSGIVLSLVDEQGRAQDGFLRLHDIYNLKLNADLVVLSACQTALGKEIRGEGLIGLTRGFMYAGAPRVVASLWRVDDRATAELMKRFYQGMLKDGQRPAAALRAAQVSMLKEKRWAAPQYWAAFTLQGEWR